MPDSDAAVEVPRPVPCTACGGDGLLMHSRGGRVLVEPCACAKACPRCHGTGRLYAKDARGYEALLGCGCGADPRRRALLSGLRLPPKFLDRRLDGYVPRGADQQRALARARRFVDELLPGREARGLVFSGPPGTGKTHLLCSVLRELALHKGVRGRYEEFFLLLSDIKDGFSRGLSPREWLEPLRTVEVLAIDEVGKGGKNREFEQGVLDEIISVRYNEGRPTLLATNYPRAESPWRFGAEGELAETLEQRVGQRIYSRLHEMCDFIDVTCARDFRVSQHEGRETREQLSPPGRSVPPPPRPRAVK